MPFFISSSEAMEHGADDLNYQGEKQCRGLEYTVYW